MHRGRSSRPALHAGAILGVVVGTQLLQSLWSIQSWVPHARPARSPPRPSRPLHALSKESKASRAIDREEAWLSFSNSVDIQGASASEAYEIYAHLPNHPEWSSLLSEVEVEDNSLSSTWSLQALGFSFSWTADITRQIPSKLIGWESTSGMKNAGVAKFQDLPRFSGGPACRVTVEMSLKTPSLLRRVFQSRRLNAMAESAIGKDLATFREVVLARKAASHACAVLERPTVNSTYKDHLGRCELLVWQDGRLEVELHGLGTSDNTRKLLEEMSMAIKEFGDSVHCTALIDMTRGVGCSPLAVPSIVSFCQKDGGRVFHTAILGPRPLMALAQMIARVAKQSGVAFFFDRQAQAMARQLKVAYDWYLEIRSNIADPISSVQFSVFLIPEADDLVFNRVAFMRAAASFGTGQGLGMICVVESDRACMCRDTIIGGSCPVFRSSPDQFDDGRASRASCVVLLRHGEREDYMAEKAGRGAEWIAAAARPWDPPLAANGRQQAEAAAARLRKVLESAGLPMPTQIFCSPLVRCVETADFVAKEFGVNSLYVENGLAESVYEAWMRQWAVPGANSKWGGPPGCAIPQERQGLDPRRLRGPEVPHAQLRPEASAGTAALLSTPAELKEAGWTRVDAKYESCVALHDRGYCWDKFEIQEEIIDRLLYVARLRAMEHPGETVVLVSHGGPTQYALRALSGQKPKGEGGMTALSVLRTFPSDIEHGMPWEVLLSNDASHAQAFAYGEETKI
ncbi:unnamed protein product [Symbiodinium natans]|uniref:Coenzyme Q-binding protein COQ10 START domain-containing protein n=1 Tax=Symbiodinium natans TaxID=878477 RepID=A0A812TXW0_9DINO|nr:unnamed protein product [Symbiodinium natans]